MTTSTAWTADTGAAVLGTTLTDLESSCPTRLAAEILRRMLADKTQVDLIMETVALNPGDKGSSSASEKLTTARQRYLLDRAISTAQTQQFFADNRRRAQDNQVCAVLGEYDPTVRPRRVLDRELQLSDIGEQAILAAAAEQLTPQQTDRARALLGIDTRPEPEPRRRHRR